MDPTLNKLNRAFGPIAAGLILDTIDLATFGPIGIVVGLPIGALAGFWLGRCLRLSTRASILAAIAGAIYCAIPFTEILPLATIVGAYARFTENSNGDQGNNG
jgi:hypothetical protein